MKWNLKHHFILLFVSAVLVLVVMRSLQQNDSLKPFAFGKRQVVDWLIDLDESASDFSDVGSDVFLEQSGHSEFDLRFKSSNEVKLLLQYLSESFVEWSQKNWNVSETQDSEDSLYFSIANGSSQYRIYFWLLNESSFEEDDPESNRKFRLKILIIGFVSNQKY